jgi:hypothetical protein
VTFEGVSTASLRHSLASVRRSIETVTRVVAVSRDLPGNAAAERVEEGQQELIDLESRQGAIEAELARRG